MLQNRRVCNAYYPKGPHTDKPAGRSEDFRAMHSHDCGGGWIFTSLNRLNQFQRDRDFEKCWGCASHRDTGDHCDVEAIDSEEIPGSVVGQNSRDSLGDELRSRSMMSIVFTRRRYPFISMTHASVLAYIHSPQTKRRTSL